MKEALKLILNGREREVETLTSPASLSDVLTALGMRADRIAVELNGELAPRTTWSSTQASSGDRLEIVHFVGGGCPQLRRAATS